MSNMSYCRFHNTVSDLQDCIDAMDELTNLNEYGEKMSRSEFMKAMELIEMCREVSEQFEDVDLYEMRQDWEELKEEEY